MKKNSGSAMVLILILIMVLVTLGTITLSLSLNNLQMSKKYQRSNKMYYRLEDASYEILEEIDNKLKLAKKNAVDYMNLEIYTRSDQEYQEIPYSNFLLINQSNHEFVNKKWVDDVLNKSVVGGEVDGKRYYQYLDKEYQYIFGVVYHSMVQKIIDELDIEGRTDNGDYTYVIEPLVHIDYSQVNEDSSREEHSPFNEKVTHIQFTIRENDEVDTPGKSLTGKLQVVPPMYLSSIQMKDIEIYPNDVYLKALTAQENINGNTANIVGDYQIIADDEVSNFVDKSRMLSDKEYLLGVRYFTDDMTVHINEEESGIIYSTKDLIINGNGTFDGAIISEGNITVVGEVRINHDMNVIKNILVNNSGARLFFQPGADSNREMLYSGIASSSNPLSRILADDNRYKIIEWREE